MNRLEAALPQDAARCYQILDNGRKFQREQGFLQWPDTYPLLEDVENDIRGGVGYVVKTDGVIAAYLCLSPHDDPTYRDIDGAWGSDEPYAVIHRIAIDAPFRGTGLAAATFTLAEEWCKAHGIHCLRVDTDFPNVRMQRALAHSGFTRRGIIDCGHGKRIAYDKRF